MSLRQLIKVANYCEIKYGFLSQAQETNMYDYSNEQSQTDQIDRQPDYMLAGNYKKTDGTPNPTFTSTTSQSDKPYVTGPGLTGQLWDATKQIAKNVATNVQQSANAPKKPTISNQKLNEVQKKLYDLKSKVSASGDSSLSQQVNNLLYQVSQNKLNAQQIESQMAAIKSKLDAKQQAANKPEFDEKGHRNFYEI